MELQSQKVGYFHGISTSVFEAMHLQMFVHPRCHEALVGDLICKKPAQPLVVCARLSSGCVSSNAPTPAKPPEMKRLIFFGQQLSQAEKFVEDRLVSLIRWRISGVLDCLRKSLVGRIQESNWGLTRTHRNTHWSRDVMPGVVLQNEDQSAIKIGKKAKNLIQAAASKREANQDAMQKLFRLSGDIWVYPPPPRMPVSTRMTWLFFVSQT